MRSEWRRLAPEAGSCSLRRDEECSVRLTAVLTAAAEGGYCALNPETGTVSQGETVEQAVGNLKEAVELYLEEFPLTADRVGDR